MKIIISGQKYFGEQILRLCLTEGYDVRAVVCPIDDRYIGRLAAVNEIPIIPAGSLNGDTIPKGLDLGITAHSFDYVGKRTRYATRLGWVGFHPSLLPRHRGRSAIEWAIRMGEPITGGTTFWLNSGIDRGDIIFQDWCWVPKKCFSVPPREGAGLLWREKLLEIGVNLMRKTLRAVAAGNAPRIKQNDEFSTWEPSTDVKDIYRPDALMLPAPGETFKHE